MTRLFKRPLLFFLACLIPLAAARAEDPPAIFQDFAGQPQDIESYTGDGRWLVVMVWAHNCHVCNQEAAAYARFHTEHQGSDAAVLGLSLDGLEQKAEAAAFIARHDLPFPSLIGEPEVGMLKYMMLTGEQFRGTPSILLYAPDGTLKAAQAGAVPVASIEAYIARNTQAAADPG